RYLFASLNFCEHCGKTMSGQMNHNGRRYYRHPSRTKCVRRGTKAWVSAEDIESVAMRHLFETFGNAKAVQRAIEAVTPNEDKVDELLVRRRRLAKLAAKTEASKDRIV